MGLMDKILSQFIEVIEWTDQTNDTLVYRFPVYNKEIKMGAQLTVRESQTAIFINEGRLADVFTPGRYTLSTQNMPIMTTLRSWKHGFNSPFKAEVYFVNMRQFTDQKWGTSNPVMMRDPELGPIRLRAFGIFSFKIKDPSMFLKDMVGTDGNFTTEEITGQMRKLAVSGFADMLAESKIAALDLTANFDELGAAARTKLQGTYEAHGLELVRFAVENISFPPEVEAILDKRTSMGIAGDMQKFTQFQVALSAEEAAKNPSGGGMAAAGVGLGAGAMLAQTLMGMQPPPSPPQAAPATAPVAAMIACPKCNTTAAAGIRFCPTCGQTMAKPKAACVKCRTEIDAGMRFCPACGALQTAATCPKCGVDLAAGAKFCAGCGQSIG